MLEVLGFCAMEGSGWQLGGVFGWLLYDDVAEAVHLPVAEALPRLVALGLAERTDVRPPRHTSPVWGYRVTAAGLQLLAERRGIEPVTLRPAQAEQTDAVTFFMRRRLWRSFVTLQKAGLFRRMSLRQLAAAGARLDSEDAGWLIRAGLVARDRDPAVGGAGTWYFRVTPLGLRVERTAPCSPFWVRVRIREVDANAG